MTETIKKKLVLIKGTSSYSSVTPTEWWDGINDTADYIVASQPVEVEFPLAGDEQLREVEALRVRKQEIRAAGAKAEADIEARIQSLLALPAGNYKVEPTTQGNDDDIPF